jgi:hypothetical protein
VDEKLIIVFRNAEMTYEGLLGHFSKTGIDERAAKLKHHYHRLTGKVLSDDAFSLANISNGEAVSA